MTNIQVDMFEVQLGAAILLQFACVDGTVRVLADAGVKASGYRPEHVHEKLRQLFGDGVVRLDLVVGTHYDEDHLNGLVPIIEDSKINITEAWLPPVIDDAAEIAVDKPLSDGDFLAHAFYGLAGDERLATYFRKMRGYIEVVRSVESRVAGSNARFEGPTRARAHLSRDQRDADFFRSQADAEHDDAGEHCVDSLSDVNPAIFAMLEQEIRGFGPHWHPRGLWATASLVAKARGLGAEDPPTLRAQIRTLVNIRKSIAKRAITASALHKVTQALWRRKIPIRTEMIHDGEPVTYGWNRSVSRFRPTRSRNARDLQLTLLAPSMSLVSKHRERLPVLECARVALMYRGEIHGITPSNQLSYVMCFSYCSQKVLITGDAGFVDFKDCRGGYFPKLPDELRGLKVLQVAHHGGHNAHFYRVLSAAGYPSEAEGTYLLLSHATHDAKRPSLEFRLFLHHVGHPGPSLLFTSEPDSAKVVDYASAIHPVVGTHLVEGDVQLLFTRNGWEVTRHAIKV